jgi:hypothetical protein
MSKLTQARAAIGGLSNPSKMPGKAIGLPAAECKTGSKLAKIPGSICADCYALKGNYTRFPKTIPAQYRRLAALDSAAWVQDMAVAVSRETWFRFHDSGDIQSLAHLEKIADVARMTPKTSHWLPTREKKIVRQFTRKYGDFPANLTVRVSATMVDGPAPDFPNTSTVHTDKPAQGYQCPAPNQGGECRDCRACWNSKIRNVSYKQH